MNDEPPKYFHVTQRVALRDDDRPKVHQDQDGCIKAAAVLVFCLGIIGYICL